MNGGFEGDTPAQHAQCPVGSPAGTASDTGTVSRGSAPWLHVVLHTPEIPNNTGNIGRSCVTLNAALHLVHPLGFDIDEKAVRRAGLDYWPRLRLHEHQDFTSFLSARALNASKPASFAIGDPATSPATTPMASGRTWAFSGRARRSCFDADLRLGDALVFGCETRGLPNSVADEFASDDRLLCLPMVAGERSLNLATSVCVAMYELVRQAVVRGELAVDENGRLRDPTGS